MNKTFELIIEPRFCELDGLGHINNASFLEWIEQARIPLFRIFNPTLDLKKWNLILARNEIDYLFPVEFGSEVKIETYFSKIGNSSIKMEHELFQNGEIVARASGVIIHYDYDQKKSVPINQQIREQLKNYLQ